MGHHSREREKEKKLKKQMKEQMKQMKKQNPAGYQAMKHNRHSIELHGVRNARELGGYRTKDGKKIRYGKLLRTAQLAGATPKDIERLSNKYNVNTIIDLRLPTERLAAPDPDIDGVEQIDLSPLGVGMPSLTFKSIQDVRAMADAIQTGVVDAFMTNQYHMLVTEETALRAYRNMFDEILQADGKTVLWHCVDGKDRTGVAAALIMSALGVDRETIIQDYLNTNVYNKSLMRDAHKKALKLTKSPKIANDFSLDPGVKREWLEHALNTITRDYGSMEHFLQKQMGLTDDRIRRLKKAYLK